MCLSFSPLPLSLSFSPPFHSQIFLFFCVPPLLSCLYLPVFVFLPLAFSVSLFLSSYQGSGVVPDFLPLPRGYGPGPWHPTLPADGIRSGSHGPMQAFCPPGEG